MCYIEGCLIGFEKSALYTVKKRLTIFPSPAGMSLTKLSLAGNDIIILGPGSLVSDIPVGDGDIANHILQCMLSCDSKGESAI